MTDSFQPPQDLISVETLATLERRGHDVDESALLRDALEGPPDGWMSRLDPATRRCIEESIEMWPEGPSDDEVTEPTRAAEAVVAATAVTAGYLLGRTLLGTVSDELRWSNDTNDDSDLLFETLEQIGFSELDPGGVGVDLIDEVASRLGYTDHEALVSMGLMAFDSALALALLENDRVRARNGT